MMNIELAIWNFIVEVSPNCTMNTYVSREMTAFVIFKISDAVKALVIIVDDFNLRRGGQVSFEDVEAVAFKIVFGVFAEDSERGNNFRCKLHLNHSLLNCAGRAIMTKHKEPCAFTDSVSRTV